MSVPGAGIGVSPGSQSPGAGLLFALFERLAIGIVVLDRINTVILANRAAHVDLSSVTGLAIENHRLVAATAELEQRLASLLTEGRAGSPGSPRKREVIVLRGGRSGAVHVIASRFHGCVDETDLLVLLVVRATRRIGTEQLERVYGLSPAEARIAASLCAGRSLAEAAKSLGITGHTARSHLRQVFAKTSTHRQVDLVTLLVSGLAALDLEG